MTESGDAGSAAMSLAPELAADAVEFVARARAADPSPTSSEEEADDHSTEMGGGWLRRSRGPARQADLLHTSGAGEGETVLLHGAAGAVGVSVLQQARILGVRVVGTASPPNFDVVRRFGGIPVEYGPGLLGRVRSAAPEGVTAALDTVGTDEAGDVSLALVADRNRVVTIAAAPRAKADGYVFIGASNPASGPFRARVRSRILKLAQDGNLIVPMAETFKFDDAPAAFAALTGPHPSGKLALVSEH